MPRGKRSPYATPAARQELGNADVLLEAVIRIVESSPSNLDTIGRQAASCSKSHYEITRSSLF